MAILLGIKKEAKTKDVDRVYKTLIIDVIFVTLPENLCLNK